MERNMEEYEAFETRMKEKYPKMFSKPYGGFAVGPGWWPILEGLCAEIYGYTNWCNNTREARLKDNPYNLEIPDAVPEVVVEQIKEKFGGLRFYYIGGDDKIDGMIRMAERWADNACKECGAPGSSGGKGWIKTLCPVHRAESDARYAERFKNEG